MNKGLLREWAGISVFERGEQLARNGHVHGYSDENLTVRANVSGSSIYNVTIVNNSEFNCTCPAATYQPICKHAVATALVHMGDYSCGQEANNNDDDELELPDNKAVMKWLSQLDTNRLTDIINDQLQDNPSFLEHLQQRCFIETQTESLSQQQVWLLIKGALPYEQAWEYHEAHDYFDSLCSQLDTLDQALHSLPSEDRYQLAWQALERLNTVCIEYVDSSHGDYYTACALFQKILLISLTQSTAPLNEKLLFIIAIISAQLDINYDFLTCLETHASILSMALQTVIKEDEDVISVPSEVKQTLCRHFCLQAEESAQWEEALDWLLQSKLRWFDWLKMGSFHMKLNQYPQAERCLNQAKRQCDDTLNSQCVDFECKLANVQGDHERHWQIRSEQFMQAPGYSTIKHLDDLASMFPHLALDYQDTVIQRLNDEIEKKNTVNDLSLLIDCALNYQRIDILQQWATHSDISERVRPRIADMIVNTNYPLACEVYRDSILRIIDETNNTAYLDAIKLIAKFQILPCPDKHQHQEKWTRFVSKIRQEMKRKRNFIRYLDERFPQ
jgi:uncharacterized Zn finger protein